MFDLQQFQAALQVNFPIEIADQVLEKLEILYGAEFDKKFGHIEPDELRGQVCEALEGITPKQLRRGLDRMRSEEFCPSLPRFRKWCVEDLTWWTADHAWAKSLSFLADPTQPITTLAKRTLDEVKHIIEVEGQARARYAFRDIYNDYLKRAQAQDRDQVMYVVPKVKKMPYSAKEQRSGTPCPPDLLMKIRSAIKPVGGAA